MGKARRSRAGRPSRTGKREATGRLSRVGRAPLYDRGNDWVQGQRARFGTYYNTALGRAYAGKMLGGHPYDEAVALNRYQAGRKFASLYTQIIGGDAYRCPLDRTPRGVANDIGDIDALERRRNDQRWLLDAILMLDRAGVRLAFDQIVSSLYVDTGPYWLDALLADGHHPADRMLLDAAIAALDMLAPVAKPTRIVAVTC